MPPSLLRSYVGNVGLAVAIYSLILLTSVSSLYADPPDRPFPPVFQPDETQHGFSEFDSLPEIPSSSTQESPAPDTPLQVQPPKDPDQPPEGLFYRLDFAKDFEEDEGIRRGHFIVPVEPKTVFSPDNKPIFLVFRVHQHYGAYQVFGRLYSENVENLNPSKVLDKDAMHLATEDDSGYLQFDPPNGQWPTGSYRVEVFVGFEASKFNKMGTMRFSVTQPPSAP